MMIVAVETVEMAVDDDHLVLDVWDAGGTHGRREKISVRVTRES